MAIEPNKLYKVEELAAELGLSRRTVWNMIRRGDLKARRFGLRRLFILGSDVLTAGELAKPRAKRGEVEPPSEPVKVEEPKPKRKPLGHELKANGGKGYH